MHLFCTKVKDVRLKISNVDPNGPNMPKSLPCLRVPQIRRWYLGIKGRAYSIRKEEVWDYRRTRQQDRKVPMWQRQDLSESIQWDQLGDEAIKVMHAPRMIGAIKMNQERYKVDSKHAK